MSINTLAASAQPFALPLLDRFRDTDVRQGLLFEGPSGWAEFAPFFNYSDEIAGLWLAGALEQAFGTWPLPVRDPARCNAIIPLVGADRTRELVEKAVLEHGMTTIKMKVADGHDQMWTQDLVRVQIARITLQALGVSGKIRIDANGGWELDQAVERLIAFSDVAGGLDYVEQPCATVDELRELKQRLPEVRVAIDESIRLGGAVDSTMFRNLADVAILKALPLGGVHAAVRTARVLELPVVVSGSLDTSVGLAAGVALSQSVPLLYGDCGLATGLLFAQDVTSQPLVPVNGRVAARRVVPDLVMQQFVSNTVADDWRARMVRAWHASACHIVTPEIRAAVESL